MTTIKLKNGSGAPLAGDLVQGEPALDLTNKRLYTEDSGGTVIEVGTNPTSLTTGTFTSTGIDDNAASTAITIDSSQNVGIGTSSPQRQFHVSKNANNTHIAIERDGTDNPSALILGANQNKTEIISSAAEESTSGVPLTFLTGNTEAMRIDSVGNVGIGTSSPSTKLEISNGAITAGNSGTVLVGRNSSSFPDPGAGYFSLETNNTDGNNGGITIKTLASDTLTERMRIDSSGNLGLGTSSPSTKLHLGGTAPGDSIIRQDSTASGTNWEIGEREAGKWQIFEDDGDSIVATFTSSGNVGIGTSSPSTYDSRANNLVVGDSGDAGVTIFSGSTSNARLQFAPSGATGLDNGLIDYDNNNDSMSFATGGSERMRIDSSGNLLVGTTDNVVQTNSGTGNGGIVLRNNNYVAVASDGSAALELNRLASDGEIANFRKDGTTVGSIGSRTGNLFTTYTSNGYGLTGTATSNAVIPSFNGATSDNAVDLGGVAVRFDDIYATNGTIQTSDRNEKQDIEALSDAEQRVAVAAKGLLRKFRWIDSVEAKGDEARIHFGIIAQDLQDAFTAEGLDAGRYAMFISSTWWESTEVIPAVEAQEAVVDEEGNVVEEAVEAQEERTVVHTHQTAEEAPEGSVERTRLGVRYSELLAFIIAAI